MEQTIITTLSDITLVTLQNCPAGLTSIAKIFQKICDLGVNVDMISLAPTHGAYTTISFTINDEDLGKILKFTSALYDNQDIKTIVSSGNYKISVYDERMKNTPGVAAKVLISAADVNPDIRLISTSDVEISLLVTAADFEQTLESIQQLSIG